MQPSGSIAPPPGLGFDVPSTSQGASASKKSSGARGEKKPSKPRRRSSNNNAQEQTANTSQAEQKQPDKRKPKPSSKKSQQVPPQAQPSKSNGKQPSSSAAGEKPPSNNKLKNRKPRQSSAPPSSGTNGPKYVPVMPAAPSVSHTHSKKAAKALYPDYWDLDALVTGLETGGLFRAKLRCNPYDRTQAYCTIPGIPYDVFIPGWKPQNRALEGDEVALRILPPSQWRHQPAKGQEGGGTPQKQGSSEGTGNILPFSPGPFNAEDSDRMVATPSRMTTEMETSEFCGENGGGSDEEDEVTSHMIAREEVVESVSDDDEECSVESDEEEKDMLLLVHEEESDLVLSPALFPSASGGELPVMEEQAPLGLDGVQVDDEEEDAEDNDSSMVSFLTKKLEAGTLLEDSAPSSEPTSVIPAAAAAGGGAIGGGGRKGRRNYRKGGKKEEESSTSAKEEVPLPWSDATSPAVVVSTIASLLKESWIGYRPTGEVVGIMNRSDRRTSVVGVLKSYGKQINLIPRDPRLPRCILKLNQLKKQLGEETAAALVKESDEDKAPVRTLVTCCIASWESSHRHPIVEVESVVGQAGGLQTELAALLTQEHIKDDDQFTPEVLACLPPTPWNISDADVAERRDLRSSRIFSIDPPTARDLDDALSVQSLGNGLYRIGVHIADVSHFVVQGTPLDSEAALRSTSVYLVNRVIPMLPRLLCEELCSLNPGVDRLAFSIEWTMTEEGIITDTWAGRTIIRSCAKLSYPQVQELIDGLATPEGSLPEGVILHDNQTWSDVAKDALALHKVASAMRKRRFDEDGALRLDNVRLYFELDDEGKAIGYGIYEQKEANRLVEEFMLAANMTAAKLVSEAFPDRALLRRHMPPNGHKLQDLAVNVAKLLLNAPKLDVSSAGALQASLAALRASVGPEVAEVVTLLCTKPMQTAQYFCTGNEEDPSMWRHYALAVGQYTHFTSPIRRYPDVLVHRLLAAALRKAEGVKAAGKELFNTDTVAEIAAHANDRKSAAKAAQDGSLKLYLASLLLERPGVYTAVVVGLGGPRFFDAYVPALGVDVRVHTDRIVKGGDGALTLDWKESER